MTTSFAALAVAVLLAGTAFAQQPKQSSKSKMSSTKSGTVSNNDMNRSNPSSANTYDGTGGASTGTGLTNDQRQGASGSSNKATKVDASSSIRTAPSPIKARKKAPGDNR